MEIVEIDKNALIQKLEYIIEEIGDDYYRQFFSGIFSVINNLPTINVDIHAKWVDTYRNGWKPQVSEIAICSHCNQMNYTFDENDNLLAVKSDYCPNCGAKMDLE